MNFNSVTFYSKPKTCIIIIIVLSTLVKAQAHAQDSVQLFYMNKISLGKTDSATISQCNKAAFRSISLEINFISKEGKVNTLYASGTNYHWWKDSVFFMYTLPAALYRKDDSMVIRPVYHIACTGYKGNRGTENMDLEGTVNTVRSTVIKLISNPPGAMVYLIPKVVWERTPGLIKAKNDALLSHYALYNGKTPVHTTAQEYVYIALFKYRNRFLPVECSPSRFSPVDSVYADFLRR